MAIRTELRLRLQNSPGALGRVCQHLTDAKVGIQALTLDSSGLLRMVVDNPLGAAGVLTDKQYAVEQGEVLVVQVPNAPGALHTATRLISSAGVNVEYAYGSSLDDQAMVGVVIGVDDVHRASLAAGV